MRNKGNIPAPASWRYLTLTSFAGIDRKHYPRGLRYLAEGPFGLTVKKNMTGHRLAFCKPTLAFANNAPNEYVGGADCEANWNEWVTWNAGSIDSPFIRSARAPSKMKLVKCVAVSHCETPRTDLQTGKKLTLDLLLQVLHGTGVWKPERCAPAGEPRVGIHKGRKYRKKGGAFGWS
jgi:hypothetical protein